MWGITKVAMGATLAVALTLVLVLLLLLVLLSELCCSHLRQRSHHSRRLQTLLPTTTTSTGSSSPKHQKQQSDGGEAATAGEGPITSREKPHLGPNTTSAYYSQGVLQAPASFVFAMPNREASTRALNKQNESCQSQSGGKNSLHFIGLISTTPSPPAIGEDRLGDALGGGSGSQRFVCISNPMFDGVGRGNGVVGDDGGGSIDSTPFETPDTSPSRLEIGEEDESDSSPPLILMKKLPPFIPRASATVSLLDGRRSLATSVSVTDSYRPPSSSSSNSLCSSPSW